MMTSTKISDIEKAIATLNENSTAMKAEAERLEKMLRQVRGTRDIAPVDRRNFVGDDGPTGELMGVLRRMLKEGKWTFQELLKETGARDNRIKGCIMRLQRIEGENVVNLGTETKAIWHIASTKGTARPRG